MIQYHSLMNKYPAGAVTNEQSVFIQVKVTKDTPLSSLQLILKEDFTQKIHVLHPSLSKIEADGTLYTFEISKLDTGLYFYYFEVRSEIGMYFLSNNKFQAVPTLYFNEVNCWQLTVYDKEFHTPDWFKGGIMYQIFPDRFKKSNNYKAQIARNEEVRIKHFDWNENPDSGITHENYKAQDFFLGNLKGIEEELEHFKKLNVNCIYLNPIMESPDNHRYSTADYFNVDPYLGTNDDFKELCELFKKHEIRIILDGVFSHTGDDSIYFNKQGHYESNGAFNSINSPYYSWFNFMHYPDTYHSWWGFSNLPTVNKLNKSYMDFINNPSDGVLPFWQHLGISGWRLDVADEFPDEFLDELRTTVKKTDSEALIIGEVWEDATTKVAYDRRRKYFLGEQLDSVMNYPWKNAIIEFIKTKDASALKYALEEIIDHYPKPALEVLMNLLDSHDTERILTSIGFNNTEDVPLHERPYLELSGDILEDAIRKLKVASFIQFTIPGVPSIYYGDEIGMQGFRDPYNRKTFDKSKLNQEIFDHYLTLTNFRNDHKKDFKGDFKVIYCKDGCLIYQRESLICAVNINNHSHFVEGLHGKQIFSSTSTRNHPKGLIIPSVGFAVYKIKK